KGHDAVAQQEADVGMEANFEGTALHQAAIEGHEAIVKLLLAKGADAGAEDEHGWTALHRAAKNVHGAVVRLLLEKGSGWRELHWAARAGCEAAVRLLLEEGADVGSKTEHGWTALHKAAE